MAQAFPTDASPTYVIKEATCQSSKTLPKIFQTLSGKLSWSHYCELITVEDELKMRFYEHEAANSGWSVQDLHRQMNSLLFERVLNAKDDARREHVLALANEGVVYRHPADAVHSPLVLEFLDLPDDVAPLERDLQQALVNQIEKFMLELGRGFMFVGSNQRVPVGTDNDFVDMVFYCKPLRAYVLIELKTDKLMSSAVGQIRLRAEEAKAICADWRATYHERRTRPTAG